MTTSEKQLSLISYDEMIAYRVTLKKIKLQQQREITKDIIELVNEINELEAEAPLPRSAQILITASATLVAFCLIRKD